MSPTKIEPVIIVRAIIFTLLVPGGVIALGSWLVSSTGINVIGLASWRCIGIIPFVMGSFFLGVAIIAFLQQNGTPMIFFASRVKFLFGEEPGTLVTIGLYKISRNPMYLGVTLIVAGEALVLDSGMHALNAGAVFFVFHLVVVYLEEPHLKRKYKEAYFTYLAETHRWLGKKKVTGMKSNRGRITPI
jgi:protein-S-isoprenylcysteine O-methyltransferase Ste14